MNALSIALFVFEFLLLTAIVVFWRMRKTSRNRKDIFVSYRRDGGDHLANRIVETLQEKGYSAFFDIHDLRKAGLFDVRLLDAIENAKDFVVVLTPQALDRCADENDFVRREIEYAFEVKQNIVPVLAQNFEFPDFPLPSKMQDLPRLQGIVPSHHHWESSMAKLCEMLRSKPRSRTEIPILVVLFGLLLTCCVIDGTWRVAMAKWIPQTSAKTKSSGADDLNSGNPDEVDGNVTYPRKNLPWEQERSQAKPPSVGMEQNLDFATALKKSKILALRWQEGAELKAAVAKRFSLYGTNAGIPTLLRVPEWEFFYTAGDESTSIVVSGDTPNPVVTMNPNSSGDLFKEQAALPDVDDLFRPMAAIGTAQSEGGVLKEKGLLSLRSFPRKDGQGTVPVWVVPLGLDTTDAASMLIHATNGELISPHSVIH